MRNQSINTPWGVADSVRDVSGDGEVIVVSTSSHGGIGVKETRQLPPYMTPYGLACSGFLFFEEDRDWSLPVCAFPDLFPKRQEAAKDTILNWHPGVYEKHFGHKPTAAESLAVAEAERHERLKNNFIPSTGFGDWAWDVPKGYVYALGWRRADRATKGFLVPKAQYVNLHELVLDAFPAWAPDKTQPYSKPAAVPA